MLISFLFVMQFLNSFFDLNFMVLPLWKSVLLKAISITGSFNIWKFDLSYLFQIKES